MVASGWLASWLVNLVWLNKTSIPNFSFLGGIEVAEIYLPGWVAGWLGGWMGEWVGLTVIIELVSVQLDLH